MDTQRRAYSAKIQLEFDLDGRRTKIQPEKIAYVMIEHDYINQTLPIIYVSLAVDDKLYNDINNNKNKAKFYLNITKSNIQSRSSIAKATLSGLFNYITNGTNRNFREDINKGDPTMADSSYRRIMIGLISIELTNSLRKTFNNIYNNIDQKTLIQMAIEGTKCVVENPTYNKKYTSLVIPPITSRFKLLKFVFDKDNFYDTYFRYFMDFERSYLLSKKGDSVSAGDGDLDSIIIDIRSVTANEAYHDGIAIKNGAYYIYINPAECNVSLNQGTEKVANNIVSVDEESEMQNLALSINNTEGSDTKNTFIRTDNAALYKNEMEMNTVTIEVVKHNIDGSAFTPNKSILVTNYGDYAKYNGNYIMAYKREFYKCTAGEFYLSCNLGLKKVGNILPAGSTESNSPSNYASSTATRTSSSSKKLEINTRAR